MSDINLLSMFNLHFPAKSSMILSVEPTHYPYDPDMTNGLCHIITSINYSSSLQGFN